MTYTMFVLSLLVGSGSLAWAYSQADLDSAARWFLILATVWLVALWRRWKWFYPLGLFIFISFAAYGLWINLSPSLMIIGALGGLLAWDLADFSIRIHYASPTDNVRDMELRHIGRLIIVAFFGFLLAGITTFVRVRLTFEVVVALVLLTAIGLAQLGRWLQSRGE